MAKALKTVAIVVGSVAAIATGVGAIAGAAGLASIAATAGTIASIAGAVATVASIGATLLAKKPKAQGSATKFLLDPDGPIPYAMGRTFTAGSAVHRETWGKDNQYQGFVSVLSGGGPIHSLDTFLVDHTATSFTGQNANGKWQNFMYSKTQLGEKPSPAFTYSGFTGLDSTFKLSGLAADIWVLKFDTKGKKFAGGVPRRGWVGKFVKCYDPRKDSTYPGGSGAHRIDNEATWEWSENPWLHELTWEIGRRDNGNLVLGVGMPADKIDLPSYVYAANVADANGWKISGVVYSNEEKWAVSKTIALAGGGEPVKTVGKISAYVNSPKVSLETITKDDLIGPSSVPTSPSFQERINRIIPKYLSETHGWEMVPAEPVSVPAWETQDGDRRTEGQPFRLVNQVNQVAQLSIYQIADSRERNNIVLALKPIWRGYKPGSCLTLNIPEYGLDNVKAVVIDRQEDAGTKVIILTFRTEDDNKHPLALAGTGIAPPGVTLVPEDLDNVPAPVLASWVANGTSLSTANASIPSILITGAVDNPNADQVIFEYRPVGSSVWTVAGTEDANTVKKEITAVTENSSYEVAVSYVVRGIVGARLSLGSVTTGNQQLNFDNVFGLSKDQLEADLASAITAANLRGYIWTTAAAPTKGESKIGDTWISPQGVFYDRVGSSILLGGKILVLGGYRPSMIWTRSANQPLEATIAQANAAEETAEAARSRIQAYDDDGVLDISEKRRLARDDQQLENSYAQIIASAATVGVSYSSLSALRTNYINFRDAINPAWNDLSQDSAVALSSLDAVVNAYDEGIETLRKQIEQESKGLIDTAQTAADDADTAAGNAQTTADDANTLAAAGLNADGTVKGGKVLTSSVLTGALFSTKLYEPPSLLRSSNGVLVGLIELPTLPAGTNMVEVSMGGDFQIEDVAAHHVWLRLREVSAAQAAAFKALPAATSGGFPALPSSASVAYNSDKLEFINNVWDNAAVRWKDTAPESGQLYLITADSLTTNNIRWRFVQISVNIYKKVEIV